MRTLFSHPPRLPLIAPSILSADFSRMGQECREVLESGGDVLHVDVMDGHFVPNLTMGPDMCKGIRHALPEAFLDVHLMVTNPAMFVKPFADAGVNHLTFHAEVVSPEQGEELIETIHSLGLTAGVAVNPPTAVDAALPYLSTADLFLVMSVNPGFSGQAFLPEVLDKVRVLEHEVTPTQRIEIDGGVKPGNAQAILEAGCDVLVAASAVFGVPTSSRAGVIRSLRCR